MNDGAANKPEHAVAALLALAAGRLSHLPGGRLDAEYLLAHATGKTRTWLMTWPDQTIDAGLVTDFDELVQHRAIGMPLAYLTREREFWSLPVRVSPDTLVPRPETECLVELAVAHATDAAVIVDAGTGSGAIALALARELPDRTLLATDLSFAALQVARDNARELDCDIRFVQADWLTALTHDSVDMIVSNPPYIARGDDHLSGDGVLFEPTLALLGGTDGLDAYRNIIPQAVRCLRASGQLLVEHGFDQGDAVRTLMREAGFENVTTHKDPAGVDRVTAARLT